MISTERWSFLRQFWTFLPWSLLPYIWQSQVLARENWYRELLHESQERNRRLFDRFSDDLVRQRKEHEAQRKRDQTAVLISGVVECIGINLDAPIADVRLADDDVSEFTNCIDVSFMQDGKLQQFHIVAIDISRQQQEAVT